MSYKLRMEQEVDVLAKMLNEIDEGYTLLAAREDGDDDWAVWVDYGEKTSMAPYEGVTQTDLDALVAQHPDKVFVRTPN